MKKILISSLLLAFIIPQVTLAAWWNPLSWFNNWSFHKADTTTQILERRLAELEQKLANTATSTATTTPVQTSEKKQIEKAPEKAKTIVITLAPTKPDPTPQPITNSPKTFTTPNGAVVDEFGNIIKEAPQQNYTPSVPSAPNGILCNGKYWSACQSGLNFVCPANGDAYCQMPQQTTNYNQNTVDTAAQQAAQEAFQVKQEKLIAVNQQIVALNSRYLADTDTARKDAVGRMSTSQLNAIIQRKTDQYNIDYNTLKVQYQQILYSN